MKKSLRESAKRLDKLVNLFKNELTKFTCNNSLFFEIRYVEQIAALVFASEIGVRPCFYFRIEEQTNVGIEKLPRLLTPVFRLRCFLIKQRYHLYENVLLATKQRRENVYLPNVRPVNENTDTIKSIERICKLMITSYLCVCVC